MKKLICIIQGILQLFIGLPGIVFGMLLLIGPTGETIGMPLEFLANTPFDSFFIPGLILFSVIGIGNVCSSVLSFRKHQYAGYAGMIFGAGLVIWIFVQVLMIGLLIWLQPAYLVLGVVETALGIIVHKSVRRV